MQMDKMVEIIVAHGYRLLWEGQPRAAVVRFKEAKKQSEEIGTTLWMAKSNAGLGAAYRHIPTMHEAGAAIFELAANLFGSIGETSDRISSITEAAELYVVLNDYPAAIRCLTGFDQCMAPGPPGFASRIREIELMQSSVSHISTSPSLTSTFTLTHLPNPVTTTLSESSCGRGPRGGGTPVGGGLPAVGGGPAPDGRDAVQAGQHSKRAD
jgi:hypothetical protein